MKLKSLDKYIELLFCILHPFPQICRLKSIFHLDFVSKKSPVGAAISSRRFDGWRNFISPTREI